MRKIAVLFSGGVESSLLVWHYLNEGYVVYPFYVKCGFPWERVEIRWSEKLWTSIKKMKPSLMTLRILPVISSFKPKTRLPVSEADLEIPLRNMTLTLMILLSAMGRGIKKIAIGSLGIYDFPDNRREFFDSVERILDMSGWGFKIETPFMGLDKAEVIRLAGRGFPLYKTFSCAKPFRKWHCGICAKCTERMEGFREAGVDDRTFYFFKRS